MRGYPQMRVYCQYEVGFQIGRWRGQVSRRRSERYAVSREGSFFHLRILSKLTTAPPRPGLLPMCT